MDDGVAIDVVEIGQNSGFELVLGPDADVAEHRARHLGEEALDQIEPGAVLGRAHEGEPVRGLGRDPSFGLFGDVGRVVVEDDFDRSVGRIGSIKLFEEAYELARAVAVFDAACTWPVSRSIPASRLSVP